MAFSKVWTTIKTIWKFVIETAKLLAPFATLLSFIIAYRSFQFAKQAKIEGAETTRRTVAMIDTMKVATKQISENLKSIPEASKSFKIGIDKMTNSIDSLKRNLNSFSSSLQNYDLVLKTVAEVTEKNVALIKKQQQIWEMELDKIPVLKLELFRAYVDTLGKVHIQTQVTNFGNAPIRDFNLLIFSHKSFQLQAPGMTLWDTLSTNQTFSYVFSGYLGSADQKENLSLKNNSLAFTVNKLPAEKLPYIFRYVFKHDKGRNEGELVIKRENILGYK